MPLAKWFATGGDHRLLPSPETGLTPYRVALEPRSSTPFGSCTASSPGPRGIEAAQEALDAWLAADGDPAVIEALCQRVRNAVLEATDLVGDAAMVLAPSGTDVLFLVSQLARGGQGTVRHIVVGANELGGGSLRAASGLTFSERSPHGGADTVGRPLHGLAEHCSTEAVYLRMESGKRLNLDAVDDEVEQRVAAAIAEGHQVVLHMVVHSKTGLRAPSAELAYRLMGRFGDRVMVLVDAAQGRLSRDDMQRAIKKGLVVLFTGSKFYSGPPFSGALLLPKRLMADPGPLLPALSAWFDAASMPQHWYQARASLAEPVNVGLTLRWVAAMAEYSAYHAVPPRWRGRVYATFAGAMHETFGPSDIVDLEFPLAPGHTLVTALGAFPTVFCFRVKGPNGWLDADELRLLHALLDTELGHEDPHLGGVYHLGQPVALGPPGEDRRAYLRVAMGARLVTDFARTPDAGGAWMRQQMAGIRSKIETLVTSGRVPA